MMRILGFFCVLAVSLGLIRTAHSDEPEFPLLDSESACFVGAEMIFPLDRKPTPQCHASTIAQSSGGLVAAWFAGTHEKHPDVGIRVALHDGSQWSDSVEVANGVQADGLRFPCWNPVLFQPADGPLLLFYKVGPSPSRWWGMMMKSDDGGRTWSEPWKLGEDEKLGAANPNLIGPVKNKPIALADGSILCPSSTEHDGWRVHFEVTSDFGKTWKVIGPIDPDGQMDVIQPSVLTYPDGRLQILCRSRHQTVMQSWSSGRGKDWTPLKPTSLPNPNSGTDAVTLADQRQLLVYNHTTRAGGFPAGRQMLNVAISSDGQHWRPLFALEKKAKSEFSYPAVIQTDDGMVHITYTYLRQAVKHV
ncbi:MAG: exo-alpha-sialidase, partial [Pirellulales bacterium]|nr:exo-alpha-sialidase [Pirellulales bacterium]